MRSTQIEKKVARKKMGLSVRYTLVTLAIVLLLMASFYLVYSRSIYGNFDTNIAQRAISIAGILSTKGESTLEALKSMNLSQDPFQMGDELIQIGDSKGTIIFSSSDAASANIPIKPRSFSSGTFLEDVNNKATLVAVRAYTAVVSQGSFYVTVAKAYDDVRDALRNIIASFLIMIPFVIVVTGLVSFKLASLAITPIEESYRDLEQFTADASHELKTPLAAIKANIDVALSKNVDETEYYRKKLMVINESVNRMADITASMLYLSKLDSQGIGARRERVDVRALLEEVRERFSDAAHEAHVEVDVAVQEALHADTNKEALDEIISIIVDNAVKFNRPAGHVSLSARAVTGGVSISIADTGVGIASKDLPRIFERFYRGDESRSRETGGAGLGLSIAHDLATAIGARIEAESQEGQGSAFTLTIGKGDRR